MNIKVQKIMDILKIARMHLIEYSYDTNIELTEEEVISIIDLKEELNQIVGKIIDRSQVVKSRVIV